MADGDEHALHLDVQIGLAGCRGETQSGDPAVVAKHLGNRAVPFDIDLVVAQQAVLHDLLGTQRVTAVNQRHRLADIGKIERFLDGRVTAANHRHIAVAVEKAVTGGTGGHAAPVECLFRFKPQPLGRGACGDNHRIGCHFVPGIERHPERPRRGVERRDDVIDDPRADIFSLRLHLGHQPGPLDHLGETGVVLDIGGDGHLPAGLKAGDDHRREIGARSVDGSCQAGGTGTDDDDFFMGDIRHVTVFRKGRPDRLRGMGM